MATISVNMARYGLLALVVKGTRSASSLFYICTEKNPRKNAFFVMKTVAAYLFLAVKILHRFTSGAQSDTFVLETFSRHVQCILWAHNSILHVQVTQHILTADNVKKTGESHAKTMCAPWVNWLSALLTHFRSSNNIYTRMWFVQSV